MWYPDVKKYISEWWDDTCSSCEQSDPGSFGLPCSSWTWRFCALQHSFGCYISCCGSRQQQELLFVHRETQPAAAQQEAGLVPAAGRRCIRWKHTKTFSWWIKQQHKITKMKLRFISDDWLLFEQENTKMPDFSMEFSIWLSTMFVL